MNYLFDTGILVGFERKDRRVTDTVNAITKDFDTMHITLLSYAEFYYGYVGKDAGAKKEAESFLDTFQQLTLTRTSAKIYAELSRKYSRQGAQLEQFDLLIAAITIEQNLTIITTDTDFERINELSKIIVKL